MQPSAVPCRDWPWLPAGAHPSCPPSPRALTSPQRSERGLGLSQLHQQGHSRQAGRQCSPVRAYCSQKPLPPKQPAPSRRLIFLQQGTGSERGRVRPCLPRGQQTESKKGNEVSEKASCLAWGESAAAHTCLLFLFLNPRKHLPAQSLPCAAPELSNS